MFQFALPPSIAEQAKPPDPLYLACQQTSYPITFEWPDGSRTTYNTSEQAYSDLWTRSILKKAEVLDGVIEGESKSKPTSETPTLIYPVTLYIAPWQGTPNLPPNRITQKPNGWIEATFMTPDEIRYELARLAPPDPSQGEGDNA